MFQVLNVMGSIQPEAKYRNSTTYKSRKFLPIQPLPLNKIDTLYLGMHFACRCVI